MKFWGAYRQRRAASLWQKAADSRPCRGTLWTGNAWRACPQRPPWPASPRRVGSRIFLPAVQPWLERQEVIKNKSIPVRMV